MHAHADISIMRFTYLTFCTGEYRKYWDDSSMQGDLHVLQPDSEQSMQFYAIVSLSV